MPPKPNPQPQKAVTNGTAPGNPINTLCTAIEQLCRKKCFEDSRLILSENEALEARAAGAERRCKDIEAEFGSQTLELREKEKELEQLKTLNAELKKNRTELEDEIKMLKQKQEKESEELSRLYVVQEKYFQMVDELAQIKSEKTAVEVKAKNDMAAFEAQLRKMETLEGDLNKLKSYGLEMTPVEDIRTEAFEMFQAFLDELSRFSMEFFYQDIDETVFSQAAWESIKQDQAIIELGIPIPSSNSKVAKQMRFLLGIAILGKALERHVFHAVYLDQDSAWCSDALENLGSLDEESTPRELHTRAVLLKALRDTVPQLVHQRAQCAASQFNSQIGMLVPVDKHEQCLQVVRHMCHNMARRWAQLQRSEKHIGAEYDYDEEDHHMWHVITVPEPQQEQTAPPGAGNSRGPVPQDLQDPFDPEDVVEIWPVTMAGEIPLYPGGLVKQAQLEAALEEIREEVSKEQSKMRMARRTERAAVPGNQRRRTSDAFLSLDSGQGSGS